MLQDILESSHKKSVVTVIFISGILKFAGRLWNGKVDSHNCSYVFLKLVGEYVNDCFLYSLLIIYDRTKS